MTENNEMIRQSAKDFAEAHIRPHVMEWDESQFFPVDLMRKIAKVCSSIGLSVAAHNSLCTGHILYFGNEEQKQKYLPLLATGQAIGAWGLTEPNTGSDAGRMQCVATRDGDDFILNGTK